MKDLEGPEILPRRRVVELLGALALAPLVSCRESRSGTVADSGVSGAPLRRAVIDPGLTARLVSRKPIRYRDGADPALDRPAHVRAASGLSWLNGRLVLIQDDANFLALVDPATGFAESIVLPAGQGGRRQFDDSRGNKAFKLDLEASCVVNSTREPVLLAFGSGSSERRRNIVVVDRWAEPAPRVRVVDATTLYLTLERATEFAGSEMNIEGAIAARGVVRLIGRGNGAARNGLVARNATCELVTASLLAYLENPTSTPPEPRDITQFALDALDGVPLGFTDATQLHSTVIYAATAEASPSATEDGRVSGSVLGLMPSSGDLRFAPIHDADGVMVPYKVEGIVPVPGAANRMFVVVDSDDATQPSELCEVELGGRWDASARPE